MGALLGATTVSSSGNDFCRACRNRDNAAAVVRSFETEGYTLSLCEWTPLRCATSRI